MSATTAASRDHATPGLAAPRAHTLSGPVLVAVRDGDVHRFFRAAQVVADRLQAGVRVISVVPPMLTPDVSGAPVYLPSSAEMEKEMLDGVSRLVEGQIHDEIGAGHDWACEVDSGDPAHVLNHRLTDLHSPLLLMGLGKHHPIDRLLAAETTLRVVRHATAPVLAIGESFDALPSNVVLATDFGPRSALAAESAVPLLAHGATLHLVHVWDKSDFMQPALLSMETRYEHELPARFAAFRSALHLPPDVVVMTHVMHGKVAPRLLEFAEGAHADLVVAGRRGLNLLTRMLVGSVTTALVRGASCAVMVVPEPTFAELDRMQRSITGTSESSDPAHWPLQLDAFTRRNEGRIADLEVLDPAIGAQREERGFVFKGAAYDQHDHRIALMLGSTQPGGSHIGHSIGHVDGVAVLSDAGHDKGLSIRHGRGQTLLLLAPPA